MNEKKEVKLPVLIALCVLCVAIIAPISWKIGKSMAEKEFKVEEKSTNNSEKVDNKVKKVLFDTSSRENDTVEKVVITEDNRVLVTMTGEYLDKDSKTVKLDTKEREIAQKVKSTSLVHVGMSDICEGNSKLMFILEDGTVSYLDIDELVCGHKIVVAVVDGLSNITEITEEKEQTNPYEPYKYTVYAKDKDGNKTDISSKLDD